MVKDRSLSRKLVKLGIGSAILTFLVYEAQLYQREFHPPQEISRGYHKTFGTPPPTENSVKYPYSSTKPKELYLDLMKLCLTDTVYNVSDAQGGGWSSRALTMIDARRLDNLQFCIEDVLARGIPGDLIEAGAWRGGATIFMRAVLKANSVTDRSVWVADSFAGLPEPDPKNYPADANWDMTGFDVLAVSLETVQNNFARFGLLDGQVRFLKGWFKDSLPGAPIKSLAVLRVDADLYESTRDALVNLYPKLSSGGYVIIDDYLSWVACAKAVDDYRKQSGIGEEIRKTEGTPEVFWKKR